MKIVTARLALISIGKIYGGEIFDNSSSNMIICQNWYFLCCLTFWGLHFEFAFFWGLSLFLGIFRVVFIFGVLFFFWVIFFIGVVVVGIRNQIFEEFPPIDSSNWNESQTGSDNFHCPFGSRTPPKIKRKLNLMLKNGLWPQLLDKHKKCANGCFEEKLESNGQSTVRLTLILAQIKRSLFRLLHQYTTQLSK